MSPALVFPGRKATPSSILSASADEFVPAFARRRLWGDMVAVDASGSHRSVAANATRLTCATATHLAMRFNRAVWVERYVFARELAVTPVAGRCAPDDPARRRPGGRCCDMSTDVDDQDRSDREGRAMKFPIAVEDECVEIERGRQRALFWLGIAFERLLPVLTGQAHAVVEVVSHDLEKFGRMALPSESEAAAFRSILDLERHLGRLGIGTLELVQMIARPEDFLAEELRAVPLKTKVRARSHRRRSQRTRPTT
jgi:hypothetical protein